MTSELSTVDGGVIATESGMRHTTTHTHTYDRVHELYAIRSGAAIEVGVAHVGQSKMFLSLTAQQARIFADHLAALAAAIDGGAGDA